MVEEYDVNLQPSDKAEDMPLTEETAGAASETQTGEPIAEVEILDSPEDRQPVFPQIPLVQTIPEQTETVAPEYVQSPYVETALSSAPEFRKDASGNPVGDVAGFFPRLFAGLIDTIVSAVLWLILVFITGMFTDRLEEPFFFNTKLITVLFYIASVIYRILMDWKAGWTLGKKALKLRVISSETYGRVDLWTAFFRETFGKYLSCVSVVGMFMIFGKRHLPLHDRLADTEVVYAVNLPAAESSEPAEADGGEGEAHTD